MVLTGATAEKIAVAVENYRHKHADRHFPLRVLMQKDFDQAVKTAIEAAAPGDTVVLTPACASFDAFKNFEERGKHFKELIRNA